MEPSRQVSAFIVSTIRSLAYTQVPELKIVGLKARSVLPLIKIEQYGIQYSHNINYSSFVDYLRLLVSNQYQLVNSKESLIPRKMALKTVYYGPSNIYKFSAYTYGMEYLLEKYLHFFSTEEQTTTPIKEQLNKIAEELKLKTRELATPFSFVHGNWDGMEASIYLDTEIVLDTLEELTRPLMLPTCLLLRLASQCWPLPLCQSSTQSRDPSRSPQWRARWCQGSLPRLSQS